MDTGSPKDFVVQTDQEIVMCFAYRTGSGDFIQHKERDIFSVKFSSAGGAAASSADLSEMRRNSFYEAHGWWMWTVWMPVGFLLLATKRYFKNRWSCMHFLHALLGFFCIVVTLVWVIKILDHFDWTVNSNIHSVAGVVMTFLALIVGLSGSTTAGMMQFYQPRDWNPHDRKTCVAKFHRISGYIALFCGNATAMSGITHYFGDIVKD